MNPKYNIYEEIDRYLNHELSEQELIDFNLKLENDTALQELVEAQKIANDIIIDHELIKLKERMSKDLNKGNTGLSSHWGKIIVLTIAVGSTAIYSYKQFNNKNEISIQNSNTIVQKNTTQALENNTIENSKATVEVAPITNPSSTSLSEGVSTKIKETPSENVTTEEPSSTPNYITKNPLPESQTSPENNKKVVVQPNAIETKPIATKPCENNNIAAEANVKYGMNNSEEASIVVNTSSIKGGTPPYTFALNTSNFEQDNKFTGLKDGIYNIRIKDKNNCISIIQKNIIVKIPAQPIDEAFAPSYGEHWKFPLKNETEASISIINKVGTTVYSTSISGGYPSEWDGLGNNGTELDLGNYYFILTFKNNSVTKGNISIIK